MDILDEEEEETEVHSGTSKAGGDFSTPNVILSD